MTGETLLLHIAERFALGSTDSVTGVAGFSEQVTIAMASGNCGRLELSRFVQPFDLGEVWTICTLGRSAPLPLTRMMFDVIHFDEENAFFVGVRTMKDDAVGFVHQQDLNLVARKNVLELLKFTKARGSLWHASFLMQFFSQTGLHGVPFADVLVVQPSATFVDPCSHSDNGSSAAQLALVFDLDDRMLTGQ